MSKALHFNEFSACFILSLLYSGGIRPKNATVALPFNATLGDRDGRGGLCMTAAKLFNKFRPGTLTVHAKEENKQM